MKSRNLISCFLLTLLMLAFCATGVASASGADSPSESSLKLSEESARRHDWLFSILQVNYVMLNVLDLVTTYRGMDRGAQEANPITRAFIRKKPVAIAVKSVATAGVLLALSHIKASNPTAAYVTLGALNLLYGAVVHQNISVILHLRR